MGAVFISYRRDDAEGQAGRLYDDLVEQFGRAAVFMDVAGIEAGRDFRKAIDTHVSSCGVLLALIGTNWLTAVDANSKRRLDDPNDFVRLEIASALKRDIPVIPVLVRGAQMPRAEQLPAECQDLSFRNGVELTHARWDSDVQVLVRALRAHVRPDPNAAASTGQVHVQPEATPPVAPAAPPPRSMGPIVAVGAGVVAAAALGLWLMTGGAGDSPTDRTRNTTAPFAGAPAPVAEREPATPARVPEPQQPQKASDAAARDVVHVCNLNPAGDNFLSLRRAPSPDAPELVRLGENTILARLNSEGPWYRVRRRDGTEGWVHGRWICDGPPPTRPARRD